MKLTSPAFDHLAEIPRKFTCDGENVSPPLEWSDVPEGTQELVLSCIDPDAPTGEFVHWTLWGLSPETTRLEEGKVPPEGREGRNGFATFGYGGPCPPQGSGTHHYRFILMALNSRVDLAEGAAMGQLNMAIKDKVIGQTLLIGRYGR